MRALTLVLILSLCGCEADEDQPLAKLTVAPGHPNALMLGPGSAAAAATPAPPDDHGDDPLSATVLRPGESISGQLATPLDRDWFAVDLPAGKPWRVGFGSYGAVRVVVVAPDGSTELKTPAAGSVELDLAAPPVAGRYYLRVEADAGRGLLYDLDVR